MYSEFEEKKQSSLGLVSPGLYLELWRQQETHPFPDLTRTTEQERTPRDKIEKEVWSSNLERVEHNEEVVVSFARCVVHGKDPR